MIKCTLLNVSCVLLLVLGPCLASCQWNWNPTKLTALISPACRMVILWNPDPGFLKGNYLLASSDSTDATSSRRKSWLFLRQPQSTNLLSVSRCTTYKCSAPHGGPSTVPRDGLPQRCYPHEGVQRLLHRRLRFPLSRNINWTLSGWKSISLSLGAPWSAHGMGLHLLTTIQKFLWESGSSVVRHVRGPRGCSI